MKLSALKPGDIVDVVAPAWKCKRSELSAAVRFLKGWGLEPRVPKDIFGRSPMFAHSDEERFQQLKMALTAKDSAAVWCVRGGYGLIRLLPLLDKLKRPKHTKLVIGYSDITTLHLFLDQKWGWPSWHGPLLDRFGRGEHKPRQVREIRNLLFGLEDQVEFNGLKPLNVAARKSKILSGHVVGGNIVTLSSSLGTPWGPKSNNAIVFFEEIGERPYRIDRMLTQLQQAGYFSNAKAVIFGDMISPQGKDQKLLWRDVIARFAEQQKIPVLKGLPVGHGDIQRTLPFATESRLFLGRNVARLSVHSGLK